MAGQVFRAAECGLIRLGATQLPTSSAFMTSLTGGVDTITLEPSVFTLPPDNIEFQMVFLNVQNANKQVLARINQTSSTVCNDSIRTPRTCRLTTSLTLEISCWPDSLFCLIECLISSHTVCNYSRDCVTAMILMTALVTLVIIMYDSVPSDVCTHLDARHQ